MADDVLVGEANDEAVLGRIVLVLGLGDQPLTGIVVGCQLLDAVVHKTIHLVRTLSLSAALVLDLVPREVGVVLLELGLFPESAICASNPHSKHLAKTPLDKLSKRGCHDGGRMEGVLVARATQGVLTKGILTGCC